MHCHGPGITAYVLANRILHKDIMTKHIRLCLANDWLVESCDYAEYSQILLSEQVLKKGLEELKILEYFDMNVIRIPHGLDYFYRLRIRFKDKYCRNFENTRTLLKLKDVLES